MLALPESTELSGNSLATVGPARWTSLLAVVLTACGVPTPTSSNPPPRHTAPLPPQAGYCERLQPLLDKTVRAARLGTEMACLDVPGITDLGRYGPPSAAEEDALANCFDQRGLYDSLLHSHDSPFDISIDEAFSQSGEHGARLSLTELVPWLPRVQWKSESGSRLSAAVTIKQARFVTLVGLASKLQGQTHERRCLEALCKPEYTYVHKALIGVPSVVLTARDARGRSVEVGPVVASASFAERELQSGSRELTSEKPVTLAIARSGFRTPQTERLCKFCGKRDQACCSDDPACDGGLGCVAERCVPVGAAGQPCDGETCNGGLSCVRGSCRAECGGRGQPCCPNRQCGGELRCVPDPSNAIERLILSEKLEVEGGFFGTDEDRNFGSSSCGELRKRARFAVTKVGPGRGACERAWWFEPTNDKDCRVGVHFNVSTFGSIQCQVDVFATPPAKPDVCVP